MADLTKLQLRLLVAYVAAWRSCGRTPRRLELKEVAGVADPNAQELVALGLLHKCGHAPTDQAYEMLRELGVKGLRRRRPSRAEGYRGGKIGEAAE